MVFVRECQPRLEGLFYPTEEKRVEKFLALNLSNSNQQFASLECLYSCKFFRMFYKRSKNNGLEISISKKFFKLSVERNKTKRRIKEIFRKLSIDMPDGILVFSVFRPFGELSYEEAMVEISSAVRSVADSMDKK
jgi:ribonuclease P protein component